MITRIRINYIFVRNADTSQHHFQHAHVYPTHSSPIAFLVRAIIVVCHIQCFYAHVIHFPFELFTRKINPEKAAFQKNRFESIDKRSCRFNAIRSHRSSLEVWFDRFLMHANAMGINNVC